MALHIQVPDTCLIYSPHTNVHYSASQESRDRTNLHSTLISIKLLKDTCKKQWQVGVVRGQKGQDQMLGKLLQEWQIAMSSTTKRGKHINHVGNTPDANGSKHETFRQ